LLGFIERDARFQVKKKNHTSTLIFGLGQTINQKPTIEVSPQFLYNLIFVKSSELKYNSAKLTIKVSTKSIYSNSKPFVFNQI
jgi:hypothetical protein